MEYARKQHALKEQQLELMQQQREIEEQKRTGTKQG